MKKNYLTNGPISHDVIVSLLNKMGKKSDSGGHSFFLGQVRADIIEGKIVKSD